MSKKPTYEELEKRIQALEQVEEELVKSEQRYRFLISATTSICWTTDASGGFVVAQPSWEKFTGQPWREHKGFGWTKMIHPEDVDSILDVWGEATRTLSVYTSQGRVWSAELCEYRHFEVRAVPITDQDGLLFEWAGFIRDITERKNAETELLESELRLRQLSENIHEVFWFGSPDWNEVYYISPAYETLWGASCESLYNNPRAWTESILAEDREAVIAAIPDKLSGDDEIMFPHYRILHPNGTIRWISARAYPIRNTSGEIYRIVGIAEDITKRKQAETDLADESRLRFNLLDNIPDCIALILKKGTHTIVAGNKTAMEAGAMPGKTCFETCFMRDDRCHFCLAPDLWETGQSKRLEFEHDGRWYDSVWMDLSEELYVHYIFDISKRKEAEEALRQSEAQLRKMIQKLPLPMVITDAHQNIQYLNEKFTQLFNYELEDIETAEQWWAAVCPDLEYRKTVRHAWDEGFKTAHIEGTDIEMQKWDLTAKDGSKRSCEFYRVPLGDVGLIILQDITDKEMNEERLRQSQRMASIGNLAGGIAHDFNNILTPIIGMSEMLLEDLPPESIEYDNAREVLNAGRRGGDLVKQILSFSRLTRHQKKPVRIQEVLLEVLKLSRSTIPSSTDIVQEIQSDCGRVMADPTQIHQIAMNMITNAYHAVEHESGRIEVQLAETILRPGDLPDCSLEPGRYAKISVSDTGHGMPADIMAHIFEPYYTTKKLGKGTGLGLAVAYGLAKGHNGEIRVRSEVGKGTTFTVYLPIMGEDEQAQAAEPQSGDVAGTERILVVDDEPSIIKLVSQVFERLGYQVTARQDGTAALELFKDDPSAFDIVITDMSMPKMTGDQLARQLHAVRPDLPIVICTGYSEKIDARKAHAMGIKGFLMKPIAKSELARLVRKVLDEAEGLSHP